MVPLPGFVKLSIPPFYGVLVVGRSSERENALLYSSIKYEKGNMFMMHTWPRQMKYDQPLPTSTYQSIAHI
jgi:hypothetical protein